MSVKGLVAIITGASSGIGAGTAIFFAELDAKVVLVGRNEENLTTVASKCYAANKDVNLLTIVADVTNDSAIKKIIDDTINKFGQIDILVNNAGVISKGSIENTSMEQYDYVMNTNIRSIYNLTMQAVPHLIKTKGTIVNVSSVNGMRPFCGVLAYCVSKTAVDQFTRCLALELAPKGVRVNSVNPGVIETEIHKRGGMNEEEYQKFLNHSQTTHALGRAGTVEEIARTIHFLASRDSSYITGANVPVDGGRHAMVSPYNGEFISF